ncbi:MAG: hypothetical protein J0H49_26230 [Acidobacteria bacterium]|nr:hypothetical protein [Acidobacteriota bacterium]
MSFYSRYELVKLVRNGEPKSFQAREIQTGRNVLLHLWGMGDESRRSPLLLHLRDQMRTDPSALMGVVVEVQDSAEPPFVVTAFDEHFTDLEQWIQAKQGIGQEPPVAAAPVNMPQPPPLPTTPPPIPNVPVPPAAPKEPGEFTRMFASPNVQPAAQPPAAGPVAGEFTRLFEPTQPAGQPPSTPAMPEPPTVAPQAAPPHTPGDFTRMFGEPVAQPAAQPPFQPDPFAPPAQPQAQYRPLVNEPPRPPVPQPPPYRAPMDQSPFQPAPPPPSQEEGEFAKFFGSSFGSSSLPVEQIERGSVAPPPADPAGRPFSGPGDFTIQFGKDQPGMPAQSQHPAPPAHSPLPAGATGLFSGSDQPGSMPLAQTTRPAGPSEFTRVLQGPQLQQSGDMAPVPPLNSTPVPGAVPLPPPPPKSNLLGILVAVLSFLLILLLITVVVLVLKK